MHAGQTGKGQNLLPIRHRNDCSVILYLQFFFWFFLFYLNLSPCSAAVSRPAEVYSDMVVNSVRREGVDSSLRKYAFLALAQEAATSGGDVYNVTLTPFLSGIEAQALRLASASTLKQQGLTFNEFSIPQGADLGDDTAPLLLIYRKILNFTVYSLPAHYAFAGPVVGIITYSPPNFTTDDPSLPQVPITFSTSSISTSVPLSVSAAASALCAFFAPNGSVSFTNIASSPNVCMSDTLGDVALVLPAQDFPSQQQQQQHQQQPLRGSTPTFPAGKPKRHWKLALGATFLALAGLGFCVATALSSVGLIQRLKVVILARLAGNEEALQTSLIGISRAPTAPGVRTKPALEMDMARF